MESKASTEREQVIQANLDYLFSTIISGKEEKKTADPIIERYRRMFGCVIGAFVGDAAGARLEFEEDIAPGDVAEALKFNGGGVFNVGPGQVTDDSELAMCLIHGISGHLIGVNDET